MLLVAVVWLAAALHGIGAADIVGDDEAREAGIVQDVVAGHWFWPRFNDETLPDKPILYHWLAAIPCAASGFSEAAVRLPSALAGAGVVAWTGLFGAELLGPPGGLAAAGLVATMPALFDRARVARPDILMVLLLSAALGGAFRWWRDGRRRDATAALAFLGLATFAKGPVAPVLFGLTLGGFLAWQGELGRLPRLATLPGLAAFAVLGLGWYGVALAGWRDIFVREHLVGRYLRNLAGGLVAGGPYSTRPLTYHALFYVEHLPLTALPWTPLVALALWRVWRTAGRLDPQLRFLLCWAAAPVVAFTPAEWKLRHYLLPALPALALIAAPALAYVMELRPEPPGVRRLLAVVAAALAAVGVALLARGRFALSASDRSTVEALVQVVPGGTAAAAVAMALVAALVLAAVAWRAWTLLTGATAFAVVVWMFVGAPAVEQAISRRDSLKGFALAAAERHSAPGSLAFYGETIRPIAVYVGRPMPHFPTTAEIPPGIGLITAEAAVPALARARPVQVAEGRIGNLAHGRVVLFEVPGAHPPPPPLGIGEHAASTYAADDVVGGVAHGLGMHGRDDPRGLCPDDHHVHPLVHHDVDGHIDPHPGHDHDV